MALKIDQNLVMHVARLANLEFSAEELRYYEAQLTKVLDYVGLLDSMPDEFGSEWRSDTLGSATPERHDETASGLTPDEALAGAPQKSGSAFQVPRIIE